MALALLSPSAAVAAPLDFDAGGQRQVVYLVPELLGGFALDLSLTNRFDGVVEGYDLGLPALGGDLGVGWRHYLDPWGQAALGLTLGLGFQHTADDRKPEVLHPRLELSGRLRGFSPEFLSFSLGVYAEVGPVFLDGGRPPPDFPQLAGESRGLAWSVGVETGPGKLFSLAPYVFGEVVARIGLESVRVGGVEVHSLMGGLRLGFDWAVMDPSPADPPTPPTSGAD